MGWSVTYELRRTAKLTAEERTWLEQHIARHEKRGYDLHIAPKRSVLASGMAKVPFDAEHDEWRDLLVAITELRRRFSNATCKVADTYDCIYWDEELDAYANGMRDGTEELGDADNDADDDEDDGAEILDDEAEDEVVGRLQLAPEAIAAPFNVSLDARLEGQNLTIDIGRTIVGVKLQITQIRFVARAADGAPCFSKLLASPSGERLYVSEDFADIVSSFELFATVRRDLNELVASYDAKASIAAKSALAPIELTRRESAAPIGIELVSVDGWTASEFGDQEIKLFATAKAALPLAFDGTLVFRLLDDAGNELEHGDGLLRSPIELVRAGRSPLPQSTITALRRIDVLAKGRLEGQLPLGRFRIVKPASS
ncbi:MAG TPA: hypothetical protein VFV99_05790 [Kofleriaceae bacterium]|nr:hypothetical protein [Kofleriaceae bacterium]